MSKKISAVLLLLLLASLLFSVSSVAQTGKTVSGRVTGTDGEPLIGIVVSYPGTTTACITDTDGKYSIQYMPGKKLEFSCVGMKTVTLDPGQRTEIDVEMEIDAVALESAEVVAIGYGSVAKRDLTGSVASVNMEETLKAAAPNFDQALAGRIAGVVVSSSDGAVGSTATITIRGNNSLTQSSEPLYVIDGFPSESSLATALNPADIESIDVLKDASATAIYGARGANGVIVITTRQGIEGKPQINFSASWSGNRIANKVKVMGAYDFAVLQQDLQEAMSVTTETHNFYFKGYDSDGNLVYDFYTPDDYIGAAAIDWQDKIYRTSLTQNYNLSISGGSKSAGSRYSVNLSALDQGGIIVNSDFKRYQAKLNFSQKIGNRINLEFRVTYSRGITNGITPTDAQSAASASGWLIYSVWGYRPVKPIYQGDISDDFVESMTDPDVTNANDYRFNPALTVRNEYRKKVQDMLNLGGVFNWDIIDGLKLRVSGSFMSNKIRRDEFNGLHTYSGYEGSPSGSGINAAQYHYDTSSWVNDNTLTYTKTAAKHHHIQVMAGASLQGQKSSYYGQRAIKMTTESLGIAGINTGQFQNVTPYQRDWTMLSFLARLNYNYKYKYYVTASFRADGSSKFPTANRWGYFPSASAAWTFSREEFLKGWTFLSNGKLRASWGLTGNNRTTTPYDFYSQVTTKPGANGNYDYIFGGKTVQGYYPSNMENSKLKWETTEQIDLGLDLGFFDNRIKLTADVYLKNTRDLLLAATLPGSSGYTSAMINVGSMRNKGVEVTLEVVPVRKRQFEWLSSINLAANKNIVTALSNNQHSLISPVTWDSNFSSQYPYITQVGKPSGMMYGYVYDGTYKSDEFQSGVYLKDGVPYLESIGRTGVKPGDPKYRDINGDGIINDNDRTIIGCGQPLLTGGWSNTFNFFNFDLNIFMQWCCGNSILNANRLIFENAFTSYLNQFESYAGRWHATRNPDSDIPRAHASGMYHYSSRVVEDGSYLRIKNISLGYTFSGTKLKKAHIQNIRIYLSADNIITFTNYSGPDPEVSTRNSVLTPGFDWSAYPRAKSITGGISINI